ncbi:MAG TPA: DUF4783 domain-containing protein [Melioribacteraceae bacterium]|nr:DUF4783 domain-containing protein [Melioribacteraceae bacterium]
MKKFLILILVIFINSTPAKADDLKTVLKQIEKGFTNNKVDLFSNYFSDNCYLSLNNGLSGYYTSNQAYYIFEKYFIKYKITEFITTDYGHGDFNIMIEATIKYNLEGTVYKGQVLITLKNINNKLLITQIFIS